AAQRSRVAGYVSIAGVARRADQVLHEQLAVQAPAPLLAAADSVLAQLVAGRMVASPPQQLLSLFRPSVQPYMISWLRYDGATEIAKLKVPVLIAYGTSDMQVLPPEGEALAK